MDHTTNRIVTVDSTQAIGKKPYRVYSKQRPLCLRGVMSALQRDCFSGKDYHEYVRESSAGDQRGLRNISDLRVTEIALQNATAYRQRSVTFKQLSQSSSPIESILKKKIIHSPKRWRQFTEPVQYNKMWRSLGRDVQDHYGNRNGEKALDSSPAKRRIFRGKEDTTTANLEKTSYESLSTLTSKHDKHSIPGSRYRSPRQVLPRIVLTL